MRDFVAKSSKPEPKYDYTKYKKRNKIQFKVMLLTLLVMSILFLSYFGYSTYGVHFFGASASVISKTKQLKSLDQTPIVTTTILPTEDPRMDKLTKDISDLVKKYTTTNSPLTKYAIKISDTTTSQVINLNSSDPITSASLYKLFVLYFAECNISSGQWSEDTEFPITDDVNNNSEDGATFGPSGTVVKLNALLTSMIEDSSNTASLAIVYNIGWDKIQKFLDTVDLTTTKLQPTPISTANDVYSVINGIVNKSLKCQMNPQNYDEMLNFLKNQHINTNLSVGLPSTAVFAHKTGNVDDFIHDAGIIMLPSGRNILIVAMTEGGISNDQNFLSDLGHDIWSDLI